MGHGDLHAHNVLLPRAAPPGSVKIVDLDKVGKPFNRYSPLPEARRAEIRRVGRSICTPPEVCTGSGAYHDSCVDVFALGVLAWRLLAGRHPFSEPGEFLGKLERMERGEALTDSELLPAGVAAAPGRPDIAVLARMLRLDRAGRYPSMAAALAELRQVREG
jgi:serine/threonine protein kinase